MIERFEVGKSYRWIGEKTRPEGWAIKGAMDILLDGKPHKVTRKERYPFSASFEDCEYFESGDDGWFFIEDMHNFEEVVL